MLEYLFVAECVSGKVIQQTQDDKSVLDPTRSAFYDVRMNLPLKSFSLVGKGNTFTVDFRDLAIVINGKRHLNPKVPPDYAKIVLIYWHDTVQVAQNSLITERSLIKKILKRSFVSKHHATITAQYTIGWEAFVGDKKYTDWVTKIKP
jgi:hypothetical protein